MSELNFHNFRFPSVWYSNPLFHKKKTLNGSFTVISIEYAILISHVNICSNFYYTCAQCVLNHIFKCQISVRNKVAGIKETTTYKCPEAFAVAECDEIFSG
jgi:hypothetical protein